MGGTTRSVEFTNRPGGRRTTGLLALLAGLLTGPGCEAPPPSPALPPPTVRVAPVVAASSFGELSLSGELRADQSWSLAFALPGTVQEVLVREGEAVRQGQVLARLDPRSARDALEIARAKAAQAEDAARRLAPMREQQTVAEVKLVEVETGLRQARLGVSLAEKNLLDTVLRAPAAGVIARRLTEPGTVVAPGAPVLTLVRIATLRAVAPLPERQVAAVQVGDPARVRIAAVDQEFAGQVRHLGVTANPLTRTYPVEVELANPGNLRIGMVAEVRLRVSAPGTALLVPNEALRGDEVGAPCLYVVGPDARLQRRQVKLAGYVDEGTALAGGVALGERVVVSGTPMLADGLLVRVAAPVAQP
ncbi:MAG: efflux RND transporter periplasmic adaptor subunit [Myxococcota bacterium]|nr:efflux RND transporter periplasmic adaptor subunit [Myxococcota bacterium]